MQLHKIDTLELAAYSGLPEDYVQKVLDEDVGVMEHDLLRFWKAINKILKDRNVPDSNLET